MSLSKKMLRDIRFNKTQFISIFLMAYFPWKNVFELDWFEVASQKVVEFTLFGFPLFEKLFGTFRCSLDAF